MRAAAFVLTVTLLSAGAAQAADRGVMQDKDTFRDAAMAPLEDLNLKQKGIPDVLLRARADPYDMEGLSRCEPIAGEIGPDEWRADELLVGAERSVRREPDGIWTWDSGTRRVVHVTRTGDEPLRIPRLMDLSPAELGRRLLHDSGDAVARRELHGDTRPERAPTSSSWIRTLRCLLYTSPSPRD